MAKGFRFVCPDCDRELVKYGPRYMCPGILAEAVPGAGRMLVAPEHPVHVERKLWTAEQLILNGLFIGAQSVHANDVIEMVVAA